MCSQTPDTTRPMAKPASPVVIPPINVDRRYTARTAPSMGRFLNLRDGARMDGCHPIRWLHAPLQTDYTNGSRRFNSPHMPHSKPNYHAQQRRQRLIGIALMCGAVALFACLD